MRIQPAYLRELGDSFGIADLELLQKMLCLVFQLPTGHWEAAQATRDSQKFRAIEPVIPNFRLLSDKMKVSSNGCQRILRLAKTDELRMRFVTSRFPRQNFLREQTFPP